MVSPPPRLLWALAALCACLPAAGAEPDVVGFPSNVCAVRVVGDYAYCAADPGLLIYDLSTPARPRLCSQLLLGDSGSFRIAVSGDHVYVLAGAVYLERSYIHVIDIQDPNRPRRVSTYSDLGPAHPRDIAAGATHLFVANANHVDVLDATRPENLVRLYRVDVTDRPLAVTSLVLRGTMLFASWTGIAEGGVVSLDVARPGGPLRVGEFATDGAVDMMVGQTDTLYLGSSPQGLSILDAGDPKSITLVKRISYGNRIVQALFAGDGYLFVEAADLANAVKTLCVYDVKSSQSPIVLGRSRCSGSVRGMDFDSARLRAIMPWYTVSGNGLAVAELGEDGSLQPIGQTLEPSIADVVISNGTTFLAASNSLVAARVDPAGNVDVLGSLTFSQGAVRIKIVGSSAYVTTHRGEQPLRPQLQIVDIADPGRMRLLRSVPLDSLAGDDSSWYSGMFDVDGELLYFPHARGLSIFDVSDPSSIEPLGLLPTQDPAEHVSVEGDRAYVAAVHLNPDSLIKRIDLYVVNVSHPGSPALVGKLLGLTRADFTNDIEVESGYVYQLVAGPGYGLGVVGDGRMLITDVREPGTPVLASEVPTSPTRNGYAMRLCVRGHLVYVADGLEGVSVWSVGDRSHPQFLRSQQTPGFAMAVWVDQNRRVHAADSSSYLRWKR
ncbi:MAG: hypothetical protein AB1714_20695 [Acidobacteriota bacterium]